MGTKAGIEPSVLFEVISAGSGNSYAFQKKAPRILNGNFKPMFALDLEYKDLSLGTMVAQELKATALLASLAKGLFEMARAKGLGSEDNVALVKVFEEMSNVKVRK
jgi:3-hydroxyisobutyrate dehydrogenase-like beta-hydroxyacid dehydrogenase